MKEQIKAICFIIIGILLLNFIGKLYEPQNTVEQWDNSIADFYLKDKNTVDILYVGDSNIYTGVSPLEIYEKSGITGYSYSTPLQAVWTSYYLVKEAFKTQKPKVVFLETNQFFSGILNQPELSQRNPINSLKLSKNKIDLLNDPDYCFSSYDKLTYLFPIMRYHTRWSKLTELDIRKLYKEPEHSYEGYRFDTAVKNMNSSSNRSENEENYKIDNNAIEKVYKIKQLCEDNNCELVLITMPKPKVWNNLKHDEISNFAKENNLKYLDLNTDSNIKIDWSKDSSDGGFHLNIYGAEKVGAYLENYINDNYKLENHKNDEKYKNWNNDLEKYNQEKANIKTKNNL